ncbi:hypothetical protein FIBSPDRAFT_938458, partial [Athelia psychrophila]
MGLIAYQLVFTLIILPLSVVRWTLNFSIVKNKFTVLTFATHPPSQPFRLIQCLPLSVHPHQAPHAPRHASASATSVLAPIGARATELGHETRT